MSQTLLSFIKLCMMLIFVSSISLSSYAIEKPTYHNPARVIYVSKYSPAFMISLPSNPTTGYQWKLKEYDTKLLTFIGPQKYVPSPSQLVGAGGFSKWQFEVTPDALKASDDVPFETRIILVYERPWAPQENPKTVIFTVMSSVNPEGSIQK